MDGGAWKAAVHGVAKSRTRLSDFTFTFHFHALEKEMATHSSVLAWRIPWTGEPGRLPSMGSHGVGHDWSDLAAAEDLLVGSKLYSPFQSFIWCGGFNRICLRTLRKCIPLFGASLKALAALSPVGMISLAHTNLVDDTTQIFQCEGFWDGRQWERYDPDDPWKIQCVINTCLPEEGGKQSSDCGV